MTAGCGLKKGGMEGGEGGDATKTKQKKERKKKKERLALQTVTRELIQVWKTSAVVMVGCGRGQLVDRPAAGRGWKLRCGGDAR